MTPEQIETELKHLATKEDLAELRAELHRELAQLTRTIWITQLSTVGVILLGIGLLLHFHV